MTDAQPTVPVPASEATPAAAPEQPQEEESEAPPSPAKDEPAAPSPAKAKKATPKMAAAAPAPTPASGARERKKVEHFKPEAAPESKKLIVEQGKGDKLRDIPNVHFLLQKVPGRDELMEVLHDVLYKRKGQQATRKKNILDFSGFTFSADFKKDDLEKAKAKLARLKTEALNQLLDIFELTRGSGEAGHKDAKVQRIVDWLEKPEPNSSKDLAAQAAKKKQAKDRKKDKEAKSAEKQPKAAAAKSTKRKAAEKPAKKAVKRSKKAEEPEEPEEADSEDDDLPLGTVAKLPSDEALVDKVHAILASVDVQEFNLKKLMAQLAEEYGTSLVSKKPLVKTTAIKYCLQQAQQKNEGSGEHPADEAEHADVHEEAADGADEDEALPDAADEAVEAADAAAADAKEAADEKAAADDAAAAEEQDGDD